MVVRGWRRRLEEGMVATAPSVQCCAVSLRPHDVEVKHDARLRISRSIHYTVKITDTVDSSG